MASAISFGDANSGLQAGTINGSVHTNFHHHAAPERPETPPNPSVVIPFSRDADFVERGTILDQIHQKCAVLGSRTALVGLGGVGKSQLAIEYSYQFRPQSPRTWFSWARFQTCKTWVFWVHASSAARFEQSFGEIADHVKIPGRRTLKADIFTLVHDWLRDERNGKWLVVLDNADDASWLLQPHTTGHTGGSHVRSSRPLWEYLPRTQNGSVLVTTRSTSVALKLVEVRDIIAVEPMDKAHAVALFKRKLGGYEDGDDAAELAVALEFMPLAIVQAAAYISRRVPRCSVGEYLQDFRKSDRKRMSLLDYEGGELRRDWEAKNSIIVTWQISFNHLREVRPSAADLLSLMSFFDRQGIPEALLRTVDKQKNSRRDRKESSSVNYANTNAGHCDDNEDSASQSSMSDGFEDDVLALRDYSFISMNTDSTTFEMHRLVQLATQKWLEARKQKEKWKQQFIKNLSAEFPEGKYENWARCRTLFPHAQLAATHQPIEQDSLIDWASILYKAAWYAWGMGKGVEAEKMSVKAMNVQERILSRDHNDTLLSMTMVGLVYKLRGRWDAAEELLVQVMEIRKEKLGAGHLDTLVSMGNLAITYNDQGKWAAAEELEVQVMEIRKEKLGVGHLETLTSMGNLAVTFWHQGKWNAAEDLQVQVMAIKKEKLSAGHPDTLTSMGNLASTFRKQGKWDAAEELEVQVMEIRKEKLGAGHPDTLTSMGNLAITYRDQGKWASAEELEVQVMEIRREKLGIYHPDTLISMGNLAITYANQGKWGTAEELQVEVMEIAKEKLSTGYPYMLISMANLARTFWDQGKWGAAEELEVQVMEVAREKLGIDHPYTLNSMANLAWTFWNQGKWAAAKELEVQVLEIRKEKLGAGHPDTLTSINNLTLM